MTRPYYEVLEPGCVVIGFSLVQKEPHLFLASLLRGDGGRWAHSHRVRRLGLIDAYGFVGLLLFVRWLVSQPLS